MKKEFRGFGKIFSFTFLHHIKTKGYIASTLIVAMLCLMIPIGVLAGRELIRDGEPENEAGMQKSMEVTGEEAEKGEKTGDYAEEENELDNLKYLFIVDRSEDGLEELYGFAEYLKAYAGLDIDTKYFGNDMDKAAKEASGRNDVIVLTADKIGKDYELNLLVPEGGLSRSAAELLIPLLDEYAQSARERLNPSETGEDGASAETETDGVKELVSMVITFVNIMVLYFFVLIYGSSVASCVVMEKNSKLMEVFLTAVKPAAMIMGKLLAISLSGMLQLISWVLALVLGFVIGGEAAQVVNPDAGNPAAEVLRLAATVTDGMFSAGTLIAAVVMALFGVILYCSLAAIGGSLAGKQEDLSSTNMVFTMILIISFFAAIYGGGIEGMGSDVGWLKAILDWIPFTAVMVTPSKILLGLIPLKYGIGSMVITVAAAILLVAAAGKLYRAMALYRGQKPSIRDAVKMIRDR